MIIYFQVAFVLCIIGGLIGAFSKRGPGPVAGFISGFSIYAAALSFAVFVYFMYRALFL